MTQEETLAYNENIRTAMKILDDKIESLKEDREKLFKGLKAPCKFCPYDGEYRCEACRDFNYSLFNVKDWTKDWYER